MIETYESDYLLDPINELMGKFGRNDIEFKENQGQTPTDRIDFEVKAIDNAVKLHAMGEDHVTYLTDYDVIKQDNFASMFEDKALEDDEAES